METGIAATIYGGMKIRRRRRLHQFHRPGRDFLVIASARYSVLGYCMFVFIVSVLLAFFPDAQTPLGEKAPPQPKLEIVAISNSLPTPPITLRDNHAEFPMTGTLSFSRDGKYVANSFPTDVGREGKSVISYNQIVVWDIAKSKVLQRFPPRPETGRGESFFKDSIIAIGEKGEVRFWNVVTGKLDKTWENPESRQYNSVSLSADNKYLVTARYNLLVWEMANGKANLIKPKQENSNFPHSVAFQGIRLSSSGKELFALFGVRSKLVSFDIPSGKELRSVSRAGFAGRAIDLGSKEKIIAIGEYKADGGEGGYVSLRDSSTFKEIVSVKAFEGTVFRVAFAKNDKYLIATGCDGEMSPCLMRVWEVNTGKQVFGCSFEKHEMISFAVSPDSNQLAITVRAPTVQIYDLDKLVGQK